MRSVVCLVGALTCAICARGQDARARFLADYEGPAGRLRPAYTNFTTRVVATEFAKDGNPRSVQNYTAKVGPTAKHHVLEGTSQHFGTDGRRERPKRYADGLNPRYEFALDGRRSGSGYVLTRFTRAAEHRLPELTHFCFPFVDHLAAARTYLDLVKDPGTTVFDYADVTWRGRAVKRLETKFAGIDRSNMTKISLRIAFLFRPDDGWVCCGVQGLATGQHSGEPPEAETVYTYVSRPGELPVPKSVERWHRADGSTPRLDYRLELSEFRRHPTPFPERDFTLAAFSLPEPGTAAFDRQPPLSPEDAGAIPPPAEPGGLPGWVWAAGATIFIVVLALVLRRGRRMVAA